jgi:hypothetical protein
MNESDANGIQFGVAKCTPEVRDVERTRVKTALPRVSAGVVESVPIGSVASVSVFKRVGECVPEVRDRNQVHVIRHEGKTDHGEAIQIGVFLQKFKINVALLGRGEDELASVSTLRDVMRDIESDNTRHAGHGSKVAPDAGEA